MWVGRDGWGGKNLSYIGEVNLRFHPRMLGLQDPEIYEPKQKNTVNQHLLWYVRGANALDNYFGPSNKPIAK